MTTPPDGYLAASFLYEFIDTGEVMSVTCGCSNFVPRTAAVMAGILSDAWKAGFTAASTLDSYRYVGCYVLANLGGVLHSFTTTDNIDGTVHADPVSPAVAVGVKKSCAIAGKKHRGRMYLPPAVLAEANVNGAGVIDLATIGTLQAKVDVFKDQVTAAGEDLVVLHKDHSVAPDVILQLQVRSNVRTQRRRQKLT